MSDNTKIEWADSTFNPWIGCRKVSPGCENCYMFARQHRFGKKGTDRIRTTPATWRNPVKWNAGGGICAECGTEIKHVGGGMGDCSCGAIGSGPGEWRHRRVFPSLCDWLDPEVPADWLADFLNLIRNTPRLTWLLLTKRPEKFHERIFAVRDMFWTGNLPYTEEADARGRFVDEWAQGRPPHNVWVGTSVESQEYADQRIPELLRIPAALRFLSVEPLMGALDLLGCFTTAQREAGFVQWVIVGGESGPKARLCHVDWIRGVVRQCKAAKVPVFVKQLGSFANVRNDGEDERQWPGNSVPFDDRYEPAFQGETAPLRFIHPKGGDISEWPEDLRVRELPSVTQREAIR